MIHRVKTAAGRALSDLVRLSLAALVAGALSRCAWEDSRELVQRINLVAQNHPGLPLPMHAPLQGCKESGCICRGATLVASLVVDQCQAQVIEWFPPPVNESFASLPNGATAVVVPSAGDCIAPPISGRQLRALYASLVI